jgi:Zn-dependent peptidase ImmA (M78 family)
MYESLKAPLPAEIESEEKQKLKMLLYEVRRAYPNLTVHVKKNKARREIYPSGFYYSNQSKIVIHYSLQTPPNLILSFLIHEIGHHLLHISGQRLDLSQDIETVMNDELHEEKLAWMVGRRFFLKSTKQKLPYRFNDIKKVCLNSYREAHKNMSKAYNAALEYIKRRMQ